MLGFLVRFKTQLIIMALVFVIGIIVGAWAVNKFYAHGKINMLDNYIDRIQESHRNTVNDMNQLHKKKLKIAQDSVRIERVNVYVKDNRECDINADTEQLLNSARVGLSIPTRGTDGGTPGPTPITQRQQIESCARDGIDYRNLLEDNRALQKFIRENWKAK